MNSLLAILAIGTISFVIAVISNFVFDHRIFALPLRWWLPLQEEMYNLFYLKCTMVYIDWVIVGVTLGMIRLAYSILSEEAHAERNEG